MTKLNWEKTNREQKTYEIKKYSPHHFCPQCRTPLYPPLPVCNSCFIKNGYSKKPKHISKQPVLGVETVKSGVQYRR